MWKVKVKVVTLFDEKLIKEWSRQRGVTEMSSVDNSCHILAYYKIVSRVISEYSLRQEFFAAEEFH